MTPEEEYQKAKQIILDYETEQKQLYDLRVEEFRKDLTEYFKTNLLGGEFLIEKFELRNDRIIPTRPALEEMYDGDNNEDIERLCEKHNVKFSIVHWCYHK